MKFNITHEKTTEDFTGNNKPLVTVVMPSYNSPDLYKSIDSVLVQTYENIEFILVDDCSEDFNISEVEAYIQTHATSNLKRIIVEKNEHNLGTVKTMNIAYKRSSGKYLITLACDDLFIDKRVVSDWINEFEKKGSLISTAKYKDYDYSLNMMVKTQPSRKNIKVIKSASTNELFDELIPINFIMGCATARSRECIEKYGFLDEKYRLLDDYPNYLALLRQGVKIDFFDRYVVKHRLGGISSSEKFMQGEYENESDFILETEAFPYLYDDTKKREEYQIWKHNVTTKSEYVQLREKWEKNRFISDLIFIRFNFGRMIRNPKYVLYILRKRYFSR